MTAQAKTLDEVYDDLRAPFPDHVHKFRIGSTWGNRSGGRSGRPLVYIDARDVMDRLDEIVGPGGWEDRIRPTNVAGAFVCELTILGVTKSAVGQAGDGESEKEKSGESDALKRAAVKFGVGRYLYNIDLPPVDLVEKNGKYDLPGGRDWRPAGSIARFISGRREAAAPPRPAPAPAAGPASAGEGAPLVSNGVQIRPPSRNKLFESKVRALKARALELLSWDERALTGAVQKRYGAPSLADLEPHEFTELMEKGLAAVAAAREAKQQTA